MAMTVKKWSKPSQFAGGSSSRLKPRRKCRPQLIIIRIRNTLPRKGSVHAPQKPTFMLIRKRRALPEKAAMPRVSPRSRACPVSPSI